MKSFRYFYALLFLLPLGLQDTLQGQDRGANSRAVVPQPSRNPVQQGNAPQANRGDRAQAPNPRANNPRNTPQNSGRNNARNTVQRAGTPPARTPTQRQGNQNNANQSRAANNQRNQNQNRQNGQTLPSGPLVPYFGEPEPAEQPILAFGQKEPAKPVAQPTPTPPPVNPQDQIVKSAREIMGRYDKTKNGTLDKNQEEWVSSLPFKPEAADQNSDGRISLAELITVLGGQQTAAIKAVTYSMKPSAAYDRLPEGTPDWFFEMDKNKDVQLSLAEYLNVRGMTEADADEFRFLDANNDGMATIGEIMLVLKEFEEERRRLAEEAQREQQRSAETSNGSNRPQNGRERHTIVRKNNEGEEVVEVVEIEVTK